MYIQVVAFERAADDYGFASQFCKSIMEIVNFP